MQSCLHGECLSTCWHPLSAEGNPLLQKKAISTCPFYFPGDWSAWISWLAVLNTALLWGFLSDQSEAFCCSLTPKGNEPGWGNAVWIHVHQSQQGRAFMFASKNFCRPAKTPQQGQLEEVPVTLQSCGMNHCYPSLAKRALWMHLLGEFLPRSPYLAPAVPPWPAAAWQICVTGCWHPARPALLFGRCVVLMFTTFAGLVLVPPY